MKKILFLLLVTISSYAQTYQNPTFGTVTTKTNTESATATKINVQETDGKINWLQPVNIPIPYVPTNYLPTATTLGGHLTGIDNKLGSIVATTAGQTTRVWFTADQTTITAGTFDLTNQANKGTAPSHIQSVTNDDNQKKYYTTDLISIAFPNASLSPPGIYAGNLSASTTPNSAQQRWTVEIYKCNNAGAPIASGITGAPVGDLGVTVIAILDSGLLTLADGSVTNVQVSGNLASPLSMAVGERIRYHVSAEKVGTAASNITQSVYYGNSYNSYYDVPVPLNTTAVLNLSGVTGATTTDALNTLNTSIASIPNKYAIRNPIYYKGKNIYWFGDSYTSGTGASPTSNRFTTIVSSALGATEVNFGTAGTTLEKRAPIDYMASPNMVDNVINIPTKISSMAMLVFAYGLNDMGQTAPAYSTANYKTDYQTVLNNAFSKGWLPNQILIIPAYYIGSAGYAAYAAITGNAAPTEARHLSFIQAAKEVADTNGTMYFDIYQDQKKNDITLIGVDNIHPTNAGYAYIANDVLQYLGADKLSITTDTNYSSGVGFIAKINGNKLDNSFIYQNASGVGVATKNIFTTLHMSSTVTSSEMQISNSTTTDAINKGALIALNGLNFGINNKENGYFNLGTNNATNMRIHANGSVSINNTTDPGANYLSVTGITTASDGFQITAAVADVRNRLISFKSADNAGISYFAGTSGRNGVSSYGLHFTTATSAGSPFTFGIDGFATLQAVNISTAPTTSAGTYDFLTRNTSTGAVEKVLSSTIATTSNAILTTTNQTKEGILTIQNPADSDDKVILDPTSAGGEKLTIRNNQGTTAYKITDTGAGQGSYQAGTTSAYIYGRQSGPLQLGASIAFIVPNATDPTHAVNKGQLDGAMIKPIRSITATTTALVTDYTILCDATSGAITLNLPAAASNTGLVLCVKKINNTANNITIDPNGAELIDLGATLVVSTYLQSVIFQSNGAGWYKIN